MAVRLRYLAHDLEVPDGQFVIGRSADCQLSLDDPLVSRRHALLTVSGTTVVIEDLGSRNGVLVNQARIDGPRKIDDGDTITIGGQLLTIGVSAESSPSQRIGAEAARYRALEQTLAAMQPRELVEDTESTTSIATAEMLGAPNPDRRVSPLSLIGGVADKALALGRADEAERLLSRALNDILERARRGETIQAEVAAQAASYATRLASATGHGSWIDLVFSLYTHQRRLLPAAIIDELYRVVRRVKGIDLATLRTYAQVLRSDVASLSPNERFLLQRIEGLERLGAVL